MNVVIRSGAIALFFAIASVSCIDNDDNALSYNQVTLADSYPDGIPAEFTVLSGKATFRELNTGEITTMTLPFYSPGLLSDGLYDVDATETVEFVNDSGETVRRTLRASATSVSITSASSIALEWYYYNPQSSLIFDCIFFSGSLNATATGGLRDSYMTIYNNTDEVIYADGLGIAESAFVNASTNAFEILTPANDRQINFTAGTIWVIPGSGKDVPVEPGGSIKIVDQAIDWNAQVAGAQNHTDADFEWVDDNYQDTDNPDVPNLDKWYCYSLSIWIPSNQCNRSYALVRFPKGMTAEEYLGAYHGRYEYISAIGTQMVNNNAYLIPNDWIIDGVNLSNKEMWVYGALANSIDAGYASISDKNRDPERFGKMFRRKVASTTADGRQILQDTNDSGTDFILVKVQN